MATSSIQQAVNALLLQQRTSENWGRLYRGRARRRRLCAHLTLCCTNPLSFLALRDTVIYEAVIVTRNADNTAHITPLGFRWRAEHVVLAPFRPSTTLDNLQRSRQAVLNLTDNVAVIAGCLTGRQDWPIVPTPTVQGWRLADTLTHMELEIDTIEGDKARPRFYCNVVHQETHLGFKGFNRAQAAVIEAAILVSRLHLLPAEKIDNEIEYLRIALEKTAGERERLAWGWLMERIESFRRASKAEVL